MQFIPAIDILDEKVVRLYKGDYNAVTQYQSTVKEQAKIFSDIGVKRIHIVDLNGAKEGSTVNFESVKKARSEAPGIEIEIGGGIRNFESIERYLDIGIDYVILGTKAVIDKDFLKTAVEKYGERIIVGLDTKEGAPALSGWLETSKESTSSLLDYYKGIGVSSLIHTDISTDGTFSGVNAENVRAILKSCGIDFIHSGGVATMEDLRLLKSLSKEHSNLKGVIVGKAVYDGRIKSEEAVELFKE